MTVVLVPIVAIYGADGVLVVGLLAGLILIGLGFAGPAGSSATCRSPWSRGSRSASR